MFQLFRLRCFRSEQSGMERINHWFSTIWVTLYSRVQNAASAHFMRRFLLEGMLVGILWIGIGSWLIPTAQAATTPETEAYQVGPIRKTRNPLSNENFQGGVEQSALEHRENPRSPEAENKGFLETVKDTLFGSEAEPAPADFEAEKNPTLKNYTNLQD